MILNSLKPDNYHKIDNFVSRSAQIKKENIKWLKDNGVTDVINFRTMYVPSIDFDEKKLLLESDINYHNIPSVSKYPDEIKVGKFLDIVEGVKKKDGKVHIHCKQGADRTGLYSYIYERLNQIGSLFDNVMELYKHGYHYEKYPDMLSWAELYVRKYRLK